MKIQTKFKKYNKILTSFVIGFILIVPVIELVILKSSIKKSPINSKTPSNNSDINAILWKFGQGLIGEGPTMQPRLVRFTEEGEQFVVVGTDGGLAVINLDGFINMTYITFKEVIDFDLIDDISGDDAMDIVLNTYDQERPNVFAVSSKDGEELWSYTPKVESIASDTFTTQEYIPHSWDVKAINDINKDGISDVVISSWYKLIALDGRTGYEIWVNDKDFTNDIWKIEFYNDTIVAGSENGELLALNPTNGQKIWIYKVPPIRMEVVSVGTVGFFERDVPNSIDDILIVDDVTNDSINEILVASDDGVIRLISGSSGVILDRLVFYNLSYYEGSLPSNVRIDTEIGDSPYLGESRIFRNPGAKFFEFPDINNDGKKEYCIYAYLLDYGWMKMFERWFNNTIFNINGQKLEILEKFDYNDDYFGSSSYPVPSNNGSEIYLYFYMYMLPSMQSEKSAGIYRTNFEKKNFTNLTLVYRDYDFHILDVEKETTKFYLLNVGDVTNDGIDEIFAINRLNKYLLIDCKNNETIWVRYLKKGESKLTEIQDINGDGVNDLLYKKIRDFEPSWEESVIEDGLISEFLILDSKNGDIIWEFKVPSPQYYEGSRSVLNIGDINGDDINDYAAWMIPSKIPQEVSNLVKSLSGNPFLNLYDKERETAIYRALMGEYTRLLVINGSNGLILWDTPLIDFPYRFYRDFGNFGNYTNPSGLYSNGGNYYLRRNSQLPESWRGEWDEILWENEWTPSTLLHANKIGIEFGEYSSGNIYDLSDIHGNYTLKANKQLSGSIWKTVLNLTIPLDFSNEKRMGLIEYPLSQMERLAAFKMQSSLLVNDSSEPEWYNFTYEIYKESTNEWVLCNWTGNTYWDLRYLDLFGNFKDTHSGYRNNYKFFNFSTDFRRDDMYLITRGTYNREPGLYFDYQHKTTLSNFIDQNKNVKIRLNITNNRDPFEVSLNHFGIGAFYWGLFGNQFDRYYIFDYEDTFSDENLLNLEVQDFEIVNGTGDKYLDVLAVIGKEIVNNSFSSRLKLFDVKNQKCFTKWNLNQKNVPYQRVNILPLNNSSNNWILSGTFLNGSKEYFAHKLIQDPHWEEELSYFADYSDSKTVIDYQWLIISNRTDFPGKTNITKEGKIGIILRSSGNIQIVEAQSKKIISQIDTNLLLPISGDFSAISPDLSSPGAGYKLLISYDDYNGDNYLDHVGYYLKKYENPYGGYETTEIRIYSGNSSNGFKLLFKYTTPVLKHIQEVGRLKLELEEGLKLPFVSIGDFNNDGVSDGIIGQQMIQSEGGWFHKGANISYFDITSSSENIPMEFSENRWILEPFSRLYEWDIPPRIGLFDLIENIGDFNGDERDDILVCRYSYRTVGIMEYENIYYSDETISEILDLFNQEILFRFNLDIDSFYPISDVNGDEKKEFVLSIGGTLFCVNSQFNVNISNLEEEQIMQANEFVIEWEGNGNYDHFEVFINDNKYRPTKSTNLSVSLGAGLKKIDIFMYSQNGMVITADSVKIIIPASFTCFILTFTIMGIVAGIFTTYYLFHKKSLKRIIIVNN